MDSTHPSIPLEAVAALPLPGFTLPGLISFTPQKEIITYLRSPDNSLTRHLFAYNLETAVETLITDGPGGGSTEENVSREEALRRERQRLRATGVTRYAWSHKANRILLPDQGSIYVQDGLDGEPRLLVSADNGPALDPRFSPDGEWVAYVQGKELFVVSAAGGEPRRLTSGAEAEGISHGLAEFMAQEEMARYRGFWWSPDGEWLAFTRVDESPIPLYRIMHQGKTAVGPEAEEDHRYPFAGAANAKVQLGVVHRDGGEPVWMDLGEDADFYLARVKWLPDGRLAAQRLNREQSRLDLMLFDPETGTGRTLLSETSDVWINLHHLFRPLRDGRFIWASERTGFQHLYLYDKEGELIRPLTRGEWMVDSISGVDQKNEIVYYISTRADPRERQLYAVSFDGGQPRRITSEPGQHGIVLDIGNQRYLDAHNNHTHPPTLTLHTLTDDESPQILFENDDPRVAELNLTPPELITLESRDGALLYGAVYHPPEQFGSGPHPTLVSVYGGPHAQRVTDSWGMTVDMRAQYLSSLGFLVFKLDNRGSARRGLAFEAALRHKMGHIEVQDQVDGVRRLVEEGLTDPARVGIYGWSYGGYMALMALAQASDTFACAVAGAPVTDWDGYDTCYTERYMGTPQSNPAGYKASSVFSHVEGIEGNLLLIHGLIDENVHFRHTARLLNALITARKPYELMIFPDERHGPRREGDRIYMEERIRDTFKAWLQVE